MSADRDIRDRASFELIRYANCWEDADILCRALAPAPGKRLLSIASAGDNSLSLLAAGAEVVAADLSLPQLACLDLRRAAFRRLTYDDLLAFLGVRPMANRASCFRDLAGDLSDDSRAYWQAHPDWIAGGIIHAGKFEAYFQLFRRRILPFVHGQRRVRELLATGDHDERVAFYENRWNTWRWRLLFRLFFSRFVMGRLGRDPEFFRYVEGSVADRILARTRYALTELPTSSNPYLTYILTGNFGDALPHYLRPSHYAAIKGNLDRLHLHHGPIDEAAERYATGGWDGGNLSDIFEYLSPEIGSAVYGRLLAHANPGCRLVYWNMLAPRRCPPAWADRMVSLDEVAAPLFQQDQAWFYSAFVVEELRHAHG